ncbi:MAG: HDIG domain-containing protein [Rhizobiaceae bacterium]|nr:HDIG domain-containing protein [Rhizobiaceae bacterium]
MEEERMPMYTIERDSTSHRRELEKKLYGLDLISDNLREMTVVAWMTAWTSSTFKTLEDMPWGGLHPSYLLIDHVNEVTRIGIALANAAKAEWKTDIPADILIPTLILHDIDKPLMYMRRGDDVIRTQLASELPHGIIGAMLLRDLGFGERVVNAVAMHSPLMPFHGKTQEAYVLHYADHFACDNAFLRDGLTPLYFLQAHPEGKKK